MPEREARNIYDAYHSSYTALRGGYWAFVQAQLKSTRMLENLFGRQIPFFGQWSDKLLHEAYSSIPQSTCGDLVNERGVIFAYFNRDPDFQSVELLTQIHDSIEFQIPLSTPPLVHARMLCSIRDSLEMPLEFNGHSFVVPVDLVVNSCLNKERGIEIKSREFSRNPHELKDKLTFAWEELKLNEP